MRKSKKVIIANWKMNPTTIREAKDSFRKIKNIARNLRNVQTVVCPPFIFLGVLEKFITGHRCVLGAQDVFWEQEGSYTGEISPRELLRMDVNYVILGHSERRALGESDTEVSRKVKACFRNNLFVILCIGEAERDSDGRYFRFIKEEIKNSLSKISRKDIPKLIIAYEPIWAVGPKAKRADTPEELFEMAIFIRKTLSDLFGRKHVMSTPILYGGSVDDRNAEEFLSKGGVAGLLVGRASLDPKKFSAILKIAENV